VARYVVDVMPKREILDPQGKAVLGALARLGFDGVAEVREGKRFEIEVDGETDEAQLAEVRRMAETLLANPVIEDFTVTGEDPPVEPVGTTPGSEAPSVDPVGPAPGSEAPSVEPVGPAPGSEAPSVEPVETTAEGADT
jgi:phosphoribosylformylglycinamidine synthase